MCDVRKTKFYLSFDRFITKSITLNITKKVLEKIKKIHISHLSFPLRSGGICDFFSDTQDLIGSFQKNHLGYFRSRYFFRARTFLSG
mgnify:CR=1 FL=1